MKVFLAGATGAIGRRLLPLLVQAGHQVTGTTQHADKVELIHSAGAAPLVVNALDAKQIREAVERTQPDVIIHQLTSIPANLNMRRFEAEFSVTNRLRTEGTDHLIAAARASGCRKFIAQSFLGWTYARKGSWIKTEEDPLITSPEPQLRQTLDAIVRLEHTVLEVPSLGGVILRFGWFYGPGTGIGPGGSIVEAVQMRTLPIVGKGTGYWSFLHIDDAASSTLAALDSSTPALYNICDDEPAPVSQWLPALAEALGARPPRHIPAWLGRFAIGPHGVALMTQNRGASNQKAKSQLNWNPRWPSWRTGFRDGLANQPQTPRPRAASAKAG